MVFKYTAILCALSFTLFGVSWRKYLPQPSQLAASKPAWHTSGLPVTATAIAQHVAACHEHKIGAVRPINLFNYYSQKFAAGLYKKASYQALASQASHPLLISRTNNRQVTCDVPVQYGTMASCVQLVCAHQDMQAGAYMATDIESAGDARSNGWTSCPNIDQDPTYPCATDVGFQNFLSLMRQGGNNGAILEFMKNNRMAANMPIGGGGGSCGYHVIKNARIISHALTLRTTEGQKQALEDLTSVSLTNSLLGMPAVYQALFKSEKSGAAGTLRDKVLRFGRQMGADQNNFSAADGDWLSVDAVHRLYKSLPTGNCIPLINYRDGCNDDRTALVNAAIRHQFPGGSATSMFLLNDQKDASKAGHWFLLAAHSSAGKHSFIIVDSKNKPRYQHPLVQEIIGNFVGAGAMARMGYDKSSGSTAAETSASHNGSGKDPV